MSALTWTALALALYLPAVAAVLTVHHRLHRRVRPAPLPPETVRWADWERELADTEETR